MTDLREYHWFGIIDAEGRLELQLFPSHDRAELYLGWTDGQGGGPGAHARVVKVTVSVQPQQPTLQVFGDTNKGVFSPTQPQQREERTALDDGTEASSGPFETSRRQSNAPELVASAQQREETWLERDREAALQQRKYENVRDASNTSLQPGEHIAQPPQEICDVCNGAGWIGDGFSIHSGKCPKCTQEAMCPRPANRAPEVLTADECVKRGECGCGHSLVAATYRERVMVTDYTELDARLRAKVLIAGGYSITQEPSLLQLEAADAIRALRADIERLKRHEYSSLALRAKCERLTEALRGLWAIPIDGGIIAHPDDMAKAIKTARAVLQGESGDIGECE